MLSEWQTVLLDTGLWFLPSIAIISLVVFPWKHWNNILDSIEGK